EYLTAWLDEHQDELAAPGYRRLRQATEQQLAALRGVPARAGQAPPIMAGPVTAAPVEPAQAPEGARAAEQVALDLVLVRSTLDSLKTWEGVNVLGRRSADGLRRLLISQSQELRAELAGRAAVVPLIAEPNVMQFALKSIADGEWSAAIEPGDRERFISYLRNRRQMLAARPAAAAPVISAPAAPQPAPAKTAPVAAPEILAAP